MATFINLSRTYPAQASNGSPSCTSLREPTIHLLCQSVLNGFFEDLGFQSITNLKKYVLIKNHYRIITFSQNIALHSNLFFSLLESSKFEKLQNPQNGCPP